MKLIWGATQKLFVWQAEKLPKETCQTQFCTSLLNSNTYRTKYRLSEDMSAGLE